MFVMINIINTFFTEVQVVFTLEFKTPSQKLQKLQINDKILFANVFNEEVKLYSLKLLK